MLCVCKHTRTHSPIVLSSSTKGCGTPAIYLRWGPLLTRTSRSQSTEATYKIDEVRSLACGCKRICRQLPRVVAGGSISQTFSSGCARRRNRWSLRTLKRQSSWPRAYSVITLGAVSVLSLDVFGCREIAGKENLHVNNHEFSRWTRCAVADRCHSCRHGSAVPSGPNYRRCGRSDASKNNRAVHSSCNGRSPFSRGGLSDGCFPNFAEGVDASGGA